ncbi:hypothetical protein GCM10022244_27600 [Streptomyces gulbargensis]|uniref:Uncharacterized protein n=1 Tax=Streptomyces gulbargensis TaxID=364901 RepID=A0ABP7M734_9ACTN
MLNSSGFLGQYKNAFPQRADLRAERGARAGPPAVRPPVTRRVPRVAVRPRRGPGPGAPTATPREGAART